MKNLSTFELLVIAGCIVLAILGVIAFALFGGALGGNKSIGTVSVWGTLDSQSMQSVLQSLRQGDSSFQNVSYTQQSSNNFETALLNAIASGNAPDLVVLPLDDTASFADKLTLIPYNAVSQSTFESTFVFEGNLLLRPQGILGLPFTLDPLVMYYNPDVLTSAGIATAPKYWNDLLSDAPKLTQVNGQGIVVSAVALGGWTNVAHAKQLLSTLIMQAGDPIIEVQNDGSLAPVLGENAAQATEAPAEAALRFYTDFANPSKSVYSWNRSLPASQDAFVAGDLALYFGYASEYQTIAKRNPNLHFAVAMLPQLQGQSALITYGNMTALVVPRGAKNPGGAMAIAEKLVSSQAQGLVASALSLPSVRTDLLGSVSDNAVQTTFNQSALIARAWLDPNPMKTDPIFQTMVESVLSGQNVPASAVADAARALQTLLSPTTSGQ